MTLPIRSESRQSKINSKASATPKPQERETRPFAFGITLKPKNVRCLHRLRREKPVDLVISNLTALESITDADAQNLMDSLHRVVKSSGPILLAANALVGAALIAASPHFKYSIIFEVPRPRKATRSDGPVQNHLEYLVFYDQPPRFRPQRTGGHPLKVVTAKTKMKSALSPDPITNGTKNHTDYGSKNRNPRSVLRINGKSLNGDSSPAGRTEYLLRSFACRHDIVMNVMKSSPVARRLCKKFSLHYLEFNDHFPSARLAS